MQLFTVNQYSTFWSKFSHCVLTYKLCLCTFSPFFHAHLCLISYQALVYLAHVCSFTCLFPALLQMFDLFISLWIFKSVFFSLSSSLRPFCTPRPFLCFSPGCLLSVLSPVLLLPASDILTVASDHWSLVFVFLPACLDVFGSFMF